MNKFLTALLVGALSASAFAASAAHADGALDLVYDYKASVKRINPVISTIKYSTDVWDAKADISKKLESYSVVSDTLKGYLVISACSTCTAEAEAWDAFNADEDQYAYLLITRAGDKKKLAWEFNYATVEGGVFSKNVGVRPAGDDLEGKATSIKNIKSAWMTLAFESVNYGYNTLNKVYGGDNYPSYGLLGEDYKGVELLHAGFGKAVGGSDTVKGEDGICESTDDETSGCVRIDSISGSLVGDAVIAGPCDTPMWDSCLLTIVPEEGAEAEASMIEAVAVSGTWSVKFNKSMTKKLIADAEALTKALKHNSANQTGLVDGQGNAFEDGAIEADVEPTDETTGGDSSTGGSESTEAEAGQTTP